MARRLQIRPQAAADIDDQVWYFTLHASERVAERFQEMLHKTFARIEADPELGAPWESEHALLDGIRYWLVQKFKFNVVFYRVSTETIDIVRVLHASQDLDICLLETDE